MGGEYSAWGKVGGMGKGEGWPPHNKGRVARGHSAPHFLFIFPQCPERRVTIGAKRGRRGGKGQSEASGSVPSPLLQRLIYSYLFKTAPTPNFSGNIQYSQPQLQAIAEVIGEASVTSPGRLKEEEVEFFEAWVKNCADNTSGSSCPPLGSTSFCGATRKHQDGTSNASWPLLLYLLLSTKPKRR